MIIIKKAFKISIERKEESKGRGKYSSTIVEGRKEVIRDNNNNNKDKRSYNNKVYSKAKLA